MAPSIRRCLSVSIVTFAPDEGLLRRTVDSLVAAIGYAADREMLASAEVIVVDNGPGDAWRMRLEQLLTDVEVPATVRKCVISGHGNVGYGRANNLALARVESDYHLVLNPD